MEKIKKIDILVHADLYGGSEIPRRNGTRFAAPDELRALYEQYGIEKGVLLPGI